jgi:hypothetical protein
VQRHAADAERQSEVTIILAVVGHLKFQTGDTLGALAAYEEAVSIACHLFGLLWRDADSSCATFSPLLFETALS